MCVLEYSFPWREDRECQTVLLCAPAWCIIHIRVLAQRLRQGCRFRDKRLYPTPSRQAHNNDLLTKDQNGFRKSRSTLDTVYKVAQIVHKNDIDKRKTGIIFLDFSKAFDSLNHQMLLDKLPPLGLCTDTVDWFRSYLGGRAQRTICNSCVCCQIWPGRQRIG